VILLYNAFVRPVRDLRNSYPELAEMVKKRNHVIITNHGKSEAVLISYEEFAAYEEFIHMRYVEEKLAEADRAAANPNTQWLSHSEFWDKVRAL
jgi:prevent-host-death family protein